MFQVVFYETASGNPVVLDFIRSFEAEDRRVIGADLSAVQIGFPIGPPLCDHLQGPLWEVRSSLPSRREVRLIFFQQDHRLVVVHGFVKKVQKTPRKDLDLADRRRREFL
ncbi:type II toxin-antitoxin system RelE/ParE family toxin [Aurantimonas sp. Leaf443]|uniref:type II toxin-antitoxin system RelE/ParE family toxin n=1 Tax=Aurantimonas sp. Leaf443 TaxID=1736378 RepID=UPI0006F47741|nr:type II toxin-antitoxin system RelE/ParE family toxin [Aurantimonas sp. Leaf443]KQT87140.1 hypothetical protein ASG48_17420 [Aurantimonas sp. Leaf443]